VLLTITTTRTPATDLGYLLHKHPDRFQSFAVSAGEAHVFYPEATPERCTAALLLEIDPVALVRGNAAGRSGAHVDAELARYVNDRPYAASSMFAVAIKEAFRTALTGRCDARPELAAAPIPLALRVPALRCRGGPGLAHRVFGPLGWSVEAVPQPFAPPEWGDSPYLDLRLTGDLRLADALNHLYVLLPALDDAKHYWVSTEEVDKLVRAGGDWLAGHPERELITRRYLSHQRRLTRSALARLAEADDTDPDELDNAITDPQAPAADLASEVAPAREAAPPREVAPAREAAPAQAKPLATLRREAVLAVLRTEGARRIGDFGCGEGTLVRDLLADSRVELVLAVDVSVRALQLAARTLALDRMSGPQRDRLKIFQSSLLYRDERLAGLDAAVLMEVIEHVDPGRLAALERAVFGFAAPAAVLVTTPNAEYNEHFPALAAGAMRHRDHRFEWTRAEFGGWAERVAGDFGYQVRFAPVGPEHPAHGPPTQLAVFTRPATP
jgi:2-polyprenyl-3-methyl-5-hydroxy-6-metoxy-1,4-benzoquinol methylase